MLKLCNFCKFFCCLKPKSKKKKAPKGFVHKGLSVPQMVVVHTIELVPQWKLHIGQRRVRMCDNELIRTFNVIHVVWAECVGAKEERKWICFVIDNTGTSMPSITTGVYGAVHSTVRCVISSPTSTYTLSGRYNIQW